MGYGSNFKSKEGICKLAQFTDLDNQLEMFRQKKEASEYFFFKIYMCVLGEING